MRSEEKLRISYEKQKGIFETAKDKKIQNLTLRSEQISQKIQKLQDQLTETNNLLAKEREREFPPFSNFYKKATEQSESRRN